MQRGRSRRKKAIILWRAVKGGQEKQQDLEATFGFLPRVSYSATSEQMQITSRQLLIKLPARHNEDEKRTFQSSP